MTRPQHIEWVRERAMAEFDYYSKREGIREGVKQGLTSAASDLGKHTETRPMQSSFGILALLAMNTIHSREALQAYLEAEIR